jgi:hypothetical protein
MIKDPDFIHKEKVTARAIDEFKLIKASYNEAE